MKKLNLKEVKVSSFITELNRNESNTVFGKGTMRNLCDTLYYGSEMDGCVSAITMRSCIDPTDYTNVIATQNCSLAC